MIVLHMLWLGVIAKPLSQQGVGYLMTENPGPLAAFMF